MTLASLCISNQVLPCVCAHRAVKRFSAASTAPASPCCSQPARSCTSPQSTCCRKRPGRTAASRRNNTAAGRTWCCWWWGSCRRSCCPSPTATEPPRVGLSGSRHFFRRSRSFLGDGARGGGLGERIRSARGTVASTPLPVVLHALHILSPRPARRPDTASAEERGVISFLGFPRGTFFMPDRATCQ